MVIYENIKSSVRKAYDTRHAGRTKNQVKKLMKFILCQWGYTGIEN